MLGDFVGLWWFFSLGGGVVGNWNFGMGFGEVWGEFWGDCCLLVIKDGFVIFEVLCMCFDWLGG